jgi:hypothetical protein
MKELINSLFAAILIATNPMAAFAQTTGDTEGLDKASLLLDKIGNVLSGIQILILDVGGAIVVGMIIYGGIQYITNQKDGGKKTIIAAITGLVIIILAGSLIALLKSFLD